MARVRMEWDWVGRYPVFVYMEFLDHNKWDVKVVRGKKGDQNAEDVDTSPTAPAWFKYKSSKCSRHFVGREAFAMARNRMRGTGDGIQE